MIIRVAKRRSYSAISNVPINDTRLSWEARGVLCFLLSKPDNWRVHREGLLNYGPAGKEKIARVLGELSEAGYLIRRQMRDEGGHFVWENILREEPEDAGQPLPANPSLDDSPPVNPPLLNTEIISTEEINTEKTNIGFETFWNLYPKKLDRKTAEKAWRRVKAGPELTAKIINRLFMFKTVDWKNTEIQYIPYPATWLNGARWEDEATAPDVGMRLTPANAHLIQRIAQLREQEDEEVRNSRIDNDDQRTLAGTVNGRFDAQGVGRGVGANPAQRGQGISAPTATNGHGAAISVRGLPRSV